MYVILSSESPFPIEEKEMLYAITQGIYDFNSSSWDEISEEAKDLIRRMMNINPSDRITVDEALQHPWFQVYFPDHNKPRLEREIQGSTRISSPFDVADEYDEDLFQIN